MKPYCCSYLHQAQVGGYFFYRYPVNNFKAQWWLGIDNVYLLNPAGSYCDNTITITLKHEVSPSCIFTFTCVHHVLANWFNHECTKFRVLGCKLKVIFMLCAFKAIVIIQMWSFHCLQLQKFKLMYMTFHCQYSSRQQLKVMVTPTNSASVFFVSTLH